MNRDTRKARPMLPSHCLDKVKHVSCRQIDEAQRKLIYSKFRSLLSTDQQRSFIVKHITRSSKKRTTGNRINSRRLYTSLCLSQVFYGDFKCH